MSSQVTNNRIRIVGAGFKPALVNQHLLGTVWNRSLHSMNCQLQHLTLQWEQQWEQIYFKIVSIISQKYRKIGQNEYC